METVAPLADAVARLALPQDAWLVGGTVRDLLGGARRAPLDVDVAVLGDAAGLARELATRLGGSFVPLDELNGVYRVVCEGLTVDVAALAGSSIAEDLARRDFTIDAMALPADALVLAEPARALVDPYGGLADLQDGLVRAVSDRVFADDPARLARAFRLAATLGFAVDAHTLALVRRDAPLMARVAPERVTRELFLALDVPRAAPMLASMSETGVLGALLPETEAMRGMRQNEYHHLDVLGHSLEAVVCLEDVLSRLKDVLGPHAREVRTLLAEELVPERTRRALLKFAELLHDVGKPAKREERDGKTTFYGHAKAGVAAAREACERLRLSRRETEEIVTLVAWHMLPGELAKHLPLPEKRLMRYFRRFGALSVPLALVALADGMATCGPASDRLGTERLRAFARKTAEDWFGWARVRLETQPLLRGRDLIEELGMEPGPGMGRVLRELRDRQLAGDLTTREEALRAAREVRLICER